MRTTGDPMTTVHAAMFDQIKSGQGFIAALDQSGGSTPKALKGYGIEADDFLNDEEMLGLIHDIRSRIVRTMLQRRKGDRRDHVRTLEEQTRVGEGKRGSGGVDQGRRRKKIK